jgi:hypothetical protein
MTVTPYARAAKAIWRGDMRARLSPRPAIVGLGIIQVRALFYLVKA